MGLVSLVAIAIGMGLAHRCATPESSKRSDGVRARRDVSAPRRPGKSDRMPLLRFTALLVTAVMLAGCTQHAEKTAQRSVSPLIGTWTRDGNVAKAGGDSGPQFTKLTFAADGSLAASYVAAGIGAALGSTPSVKSENDTYTTAGDATLSIAEGTRHLTYAYRVDGSKLYLTPSGGGDEAQFSKS
jgi:hypothetical protein